MKYTLTSSLVRGRSRKKNFLFRNWNPFKFSSQCLHAVQLSSCPSAIIWIRCDWFAPLYKREETLDLFKSKPANTWWWWCIRIGRSTVSVKALVVNSKVGISNMQGAVIRISSHKKILDKRKTIKRKPRRCTLLKERRRNIKKDIFSDHTYLRCKISKIT